MTFCKYRRIRLPNRHGLSRPLVDNLTPWPTSSCATSGWSSWGGAAGGSGPVDVFVEQGTVREIGHGLDHPAGIEEYDAQGRWADPGAVGRPRPPRPVDRPPRPARPRRHRLAGTRRWPGSATGSAATPGPLVGCGHRTGHLGRAADRRRPRRDRTRRPGGPDRRRRPPRLAELPRPRRARAARPRGRRGRERVVRRPTPGIDTRRRARRLARGLRPHPRPGRRGLGIVGVVDLESRRERRRLGRAAATVRPAAGPARRLRRRARRRDRAPACAAATRSPGRRRSSRWAAQDHLRRVAQHPHGLVLRGVRRRVRRRRAQPDPARSCARLLDPAHAHGLEVATHAIGDRALHEALAAYEETGAPRVDRARPADTPRRTAGDGAPRRLRASVQPAHLLDDRDLTELLLAGPGRALLRASAGWSTPASSWPSARTRRSRRSTPGSRSPRPCTAAPTSGRPGIPSRR